MVRVRVGVRVGVRVSTCRCPRNVAVLSIRNFSTWQPTSTGVTICACPEDEMLRVGVRVRVRVGVRVRVRINGPTRIPQGRAVLGSHLVLSPP